MGNNITIAGKTGTHAVSFSALTSLFFMWGFITVMNDILIPHLKELFDLTYFRSMLIQFCFFGAYFVGSAAYFLISYFKYDPVNKIGFKNGMLFGLLVSAIGCCLFYPAATLSEYGLFLTALFVLGLGFTLLQITANPLVALLGSEKGASSRLNLAQAFNSLGTAIAPVVGGFLIFEFFSESEGMEPAATRIPYLAFAVIFLLMSLLLYRVNLPSLNHVETQEKGLSALKFPRLKLGIMAIFFYVGAEVAIGSFIINFLALPEIMGFSETVGKDYLALYWGGAMMGRFLGAISLSHILTSGKKGLYMIGMAAFVFLLIFSIVDLSFEDISVFLVFIMINLTGLFIGRNKPALTLSIFAIVNMILVLLTIFSNSGYQAMWTILSVGLFNSIMWSNIFTLSISGLGKHTSQGSSLLVMAILGGAVIPLLQGGLADMVGIKYSFFIPLFCYVYAAFFGFFCYKGSGRQVKYG